MKKSIKYFMLGAGTVIAGLAVYVFFKESKEDCEAKSDKNDEATGANHTVHPTVTISREFVERRRELARKRAAERAAERAASTVATTPMVESDKAGGFTDDYIEPAKEGLIKVEKNEESAQADDALVIENKPMGESKNKI